MILEQKEIKYKGKVVFERLVLSASFTRVPKLFVEDEACFLYLTKGAFHFRTPTNVLSFSEGDAMLSKCGNYFIEQVSIAPRQEHQVISALGAFFYPQMIKEFFNADLRIETFKSTFDTTKVSVEPLLKLFIESIHFLLENPGLADENIIATKLKELLLILSKSEKADTINKFIHSLFTPHEYHLNEIISKNLYANLSLEELAHLSNMSLATFKRKFTEIFNESPAKYILQKKLDKASQLLLTRINSISDIAYECGFENITSFNKAFRQQYGQSPTEYRLSQKNK